MTDIPEHVMKAARDCAEANGLGARGSVPRLIAMGIMAGEAEIRRLQTALLRIALEDRHGRLIKATVDGAYRGRGGMIAVFALTGLNGSSVLDEDIERQYPETAAAIRNRDEA